MAMKIPKFNLNEDTDEDSEYEAEVVCFNCGDESSATIPRGTTKETYLKGKKCHSCGCPLLRE
jgi:hypothetical protein